MSVMARQCKVTFWKGGIKKERQKLASTSVVWCYWSFLGNRKWLSQWIMDCELYYLYSIFSNFLWMLPVFLRRISWKTLIIQIKYKHFFYFFWKMITNILMHIFAIENQWKFKFQWMFAYGVEWKSYIIEMSMIYDFQSTPSENMY